jgi:predicted DCC family thiol-disulfide oxidoreductase YuxK
VARALLRAQQPWSLLGRLLLLPPISWIAPFSYRVVARYRYRLPGATPTCRIS